MIEVTAKMGYEFGIVENDYAKEKGIVEIQISRSVGEEETYNNVKKTLEDEVEKLALKLKGKMTTEGKACYEMRAKQIAEKLYGKDMIAMREEIIKLKRELKGE